MKYSLNEVFSIIDKVKAAGLDGFEYRDEDTKIRIRCGRTAGNAAPSPDGTGMPPEHCVTIDAPIVGIFYRAPSEKAEPFVSVGDPVKKGQVVGIIEAMKLMNEIEAECDGTVQEVLAENGKLVEYGQPLVRILLAQK